MTVISDNTSREVQGQQHVRIATCEQATFDCGVYAQEAEMLRPRVPALEAEVARLQVEVQDRNKGLREAQNEESLARAQVCSFCAVLCHAVPCCAVLCFAVLCCAVPCCAVACCAVPCGVYYAMPCFAELCSGCAMAEICLKFLYRFQSQLCNAITAWFNINDCLSVAQAQKDAALAERLQADVKRLQDDTIALQNKYVSRATSACGLSRCLCPYSSMHWHTVHRQPHRKAQGRVLACEIQADSIARHERVPNKGNGYPWYTAACPWCTAACPLGVLQPALGILQPALGILQPAQILFEVSGGLHLCLHIKALLCKL